MKNTQGSSLVLSTLALAAAIVALPATAQAPADLILENGFIYTVNPAQPTAAAVAVRDGEIVFVGSDSGALAFKGPQTQLVDLGGRMVMPGAHDSHVHILEAFHEAGGTCGLQSGQTLNSYIPVIQQCAPNQVGTNWVLGVGHSIFDFHQEIEAGVVPKLTLDAAVPNQPVAILEETSHSVWVNSAALQAAGITAATPDPIGGKILRVAGTNEPNGVLLDAAGEMVMDLALLPNPTLEQMNYDALLAGLAFANQNGITSLADARSYWKRGYNEAWERARDEGTLTVRAVVGLWAYPYETDDTQQIAELISMYSNDPTSRLRFSQVKLYSDGEISHTTAALQQPYDPDPFFFSGTLAGPLGLNYFPQSRLTTYVTQLEAAGFDMHIHAIGDRGVHEALDAIEAADIANGGVFDARHRLTHVYLVEPVDVPRFSSLGVIADFQPLPPSDFSFFFSIYLAGGIIPQEAQRLRTLYDAGARVVLSSDYDVGSISPFDGMETALSMGAQSLPDVDAAIRAYTIEPAYLMRQETRVGSIEAGKLADIIVLDQDITNVPTSQISNTQVLWTLIDGEEVWREASFCPPVPGAPDIRLQKAGATGTQLSWQADSAASQYNVLSSPIPGVPTPPDFAPIGSTPNTLFDAPPSADGPAGAYFLVNGQNSCGQQSQ
ncbi:MAG: amidohydrolase [bacterium]|nr:amidohydrolase [bacterium]